MLGPRTAASGHEGGATSDALTMGCIACAAAIALPTWRPGQADEPLGCERCGRTYPMRGGIVLLEERPTDDMPDDFYDLLAEAEPRHFWFGARNRLILSTLREALGPLGGRTALDVGCGTGFVAAAVERAGVRVCGIDMHEAGLTFARPRLRGPLLCTTTTLLPFRDQFDAAFLCDVIEHCPDDVVVLRDTARVLRPGGSIVVTVPAHQALWTAVDDISGHKRRYNARMLARAIEAAGLRVRLVRHFNALLLPIQVLQRLTVRSLPTGTLAERERIARGSLTLPPPLLNRALAALLRTDLVLSRLPVTIGTSLIAVAERP